MVDVRLYETQTSPAEDVWLYTTTPAFTQPLSVYMHSTGAGDGQTVDVSLHTTDQWVPVDAPDLALWLRGDMYDLSSVYVLKDQSGNGKDATASGAFDVTPTFAVYGKESMSMISGATMSIGALDTDGGPCTVVAVYRSRSDAYASQILGWYGNGTDANVANVGSSYLLETSFSLGGTASVSSGTVGHNYGLDNISHREVIVRDGLAASTDATGYACKVDGNARELIASTNDPHTFTGGIGPFDGAQDSGVAEIIVYNRALDGTDLANLHAYLDERYVWQPTDLAENTCVLWLRGDLEQSPTLWADQSGNGNDATQVAGAPYEPAVGTTLINGQATARFDIYAFYDLPPLYLFTGACTVFFVYKLDAALGGSSFAILGYWEDSNNLTNNVALLANFGGYSPLTLECGYIGTSPGVGFGTSALYDDTPHTVSFTYNAGDPTDTASYTAFDNWIALSSAVDGNEVAITGKIGGDGLGNGMVGEIAEVIIYDGVLSARDHLSVIEYLSARYDTLSASGSGSGTLAPLIADGSGTASAGAGVTGTGSGTISPLVAAGSGTETMTGTGTGTLSSLVAASSGTETFTGTGSGTISPLVAAGSGAETFTGTGSGTLQPLDTSGSGGETFTGTGSGTLQPLVAASSGTETLTGTGSGTIAPLEASGAGTESFTGTGSGTLSPLVADGAGAESFTGTGSAALSPLVASGSGTETITGTASCAILPLVCDGSGTETITGSGSGTLQPLAADGSGSAAGAGVTGTGSCALSALVADGSAVESMVGTGSGTLAPLVASGAAALSFVGTGSAALGPLVASAAGTAWVNVTGTGGAVLSSLDASGSGLLVISGTGSASISALVALGFYVPPVSGSQRVVLGRSDARLDLGAPVAVSAMGRSDARGELADDHAATTLATSTAKARLA